MQWMSNNRSYLIIAVGAGAAVGACLTLLIQRLNKSSISSDLSQLVIKVESLQKEVTVLRKELISQPPRRHKKRPSGYHSVLESSDDEDIFEEAYEGDEQREPLSSTTSGTWESAADDDDLSQLLERIDELLDNGTDLEKENAFQTLQDRKGERSGDCNFVWRLAKAHYMLSQVEGGRGNAEKKKAFVYSSLEIAGEALKIDDDNANAHKWYAITLGSVGDYEGVQAKIKNGYVFKEHILKAIELKPSDAGARYLLGRWCYGEHIDKAIALEPDSSIAHYLLGRWCFGVYMLTWIERQAAATLFAAPPTSTIDEALHEFLEADKLATMKWKENELYVAKCYIEKKNYAVAATWLKKANDLPSVTADDREAQTEVDKLLYKYSGYLQ